MVTIVKKRAAFLTRAVAVAVAAVLLLASGGVATPIAGAVNGGCLLVGEGTSASPYLVASASDLLEVGVGDCGLGAHYLQTADVTLTSSFTPIGLFSGTYDGGGHTIGGLDISGGSGVGLFGTIDAGGEVHDLVLTGVTVSGTFNVGALVGTNRGTVRSVHGVGTVAASSQNVGGLVGINDNNGTITSSRFSGTVSSTVTGDGRVGGLVGLLDGGSVASSTSSGTVTAAAAHYVGGLVGWAFAGVSDSYSTASVTGARYVGGLAGEYDDYAILPVTRTYAIGAVADGTDVGGLLGSVGGVPVVSASFWDTVASGRTASAGGAGAVGADSETMADVETFSGAGWDIAEGWSPARVWGICPAVNSGYPFLTWEYTDDPCEGGATVTTTSTSDPVVMECAPSPLRIGTTVACTVTGGDPGIDVLWRAAYNPVFAEAGVTLDETGAGEFSFTVPVAALGQELTVELVEWLAPTSLGSVAGPAPSSVPSGGVPAPAPVSVAVGPLLLGLLGLGLLRRDASSRG